MQTKIMPVETLAEKFSDDVLKYLRNWMRISHADDLEFHYFRMRLLEQMADFSTSVDKLNFLVNKVETNFGFDIVESISDKILGDNVAKYIISIVMIKFNKEYSKILEHETDRVKSESNILSNKSNQLKNIIGSH